MVDITIFELHLEDVDVGLPWAEEDDIVETDADESGGLPIVPLAIVGLVGVAVLALALVVWRRRSNGETDAVSLD